MHKIRKMKRTIALVVLVLMIFTMVASSLKVFAASLTPVTDGVWISDDADLLTDEEEAQLLEIMKPITAYGKVGFYTTNVNNSYNTKALAEETYYKNFNNDSGLLFVIDMDERYIHIATNGLIYKHVTSGKASTITDNAYKYASDGDYFGCAKSVYEQAFTVLEGGRIAEPMKIASNAILSLLLGMMICFWYAYFHSNMHKATESELVRGAKCTFNNRVISTKKTHTTKTYDPPSSSGGSSGGGGGGGGGGGFSGGGGGHSF